MLAVLLSPFYILIHIYIARWLILWLKECRTVFFPNRRFTPRLYPLFFILYLFPATAAAAGFFLPAGTVRRFFVLTGYYWFGILLYLIPAVLSADALRLFWKNHEIRRKINPQSRKYHSVFAWSGLCCLLISSILCIYGTVNAGIIRTARYEAAIEKSAGTLNQMKVILIADLHLGYNTDRGQIRRLVSKINKENPDLVIIAGDIFDNEYEALQEPEELISALREIQSRYGVYACYGNHDIEEKILAGFTFGGSSRAKQSDIRMDEFLEKAGITLLRDESVLIADSLYLYGRPDRNRPGRGIEVRKTPVEITAGMDLSKPVFVIDHQPAELKELADAGVDIDFSGHTHDGQMFPGNLLMRLLWENSCGYLKKGAMHSIVTSGVGVFGPNMRVGTASEICVITVTFKTD